MLHRHSAIDTERLAGNVGRLVSSEEQAHVGNVQRLSHTMRQVMRQNSLANANGALLRILAQAGRPRESRAERATLMRTP